MRDLEPETSKYPLELVEADLSKKESWVEAVRGCTYIYHVASPFPSSVTNLTPEQKQEQIIKPAVDGTLNVLEACVEVGGVKRVVITSSMAAISSGFHGDPNKPKDHLYTEEDWSNESSCGPYELSKTKAEKAAWEFMEKLDEDKKFELAVVNPAYVQGPLLSAASGGGTQLLLKDLLNGKIPGVPDLYFNLVDVRDVVALHKAAMEKPEAAGQRHIAATSLLSFKEVAVIVKAEFSSQGYSIPSISLPKVAMWMFKFFNSAAKETYDIWGNKILLSDEKIKAMGIETISPKDTILDTCYSLIELGVVMKKPRYRGPGGAAAAAAGQGQEEKKSEQQAPSEEKTSEAEATPSQIEDKSKDQPAEPEDKPVEPEDKPAEPEDKPAEPEDKPAEPEDKPAEPEDKPAEPENKPVEPEDKPAEPEDKPAEPEDKPAEPEDKPAAPEDKPTEQPAEPENKPVAPEDKPVEPEDKPAEPEDKPAEPEDKPAEPEDKPAEPEDKPAE